MQTHLKVLGVLDVIFGALKLLAGTIMISIFGAAGLGARIFVGIPPAVSAFNGLVGVFLGLIVVGAGILAIAVGVNISTHRNWARTGQAIYATWLLLAFPIGTIFAIYAYWVIFSRSGATEFAETVPGIRKAA